MNRRSPYLGHNICRILIFRYTFECSCVGFKQFNIPTIADTESTAKRMSEISKQQTTRKSMVARVSYFAISEARG